MEAEQAFVTGRKLGYIETSMAVNHDALGGNAQGAQLIGIRGSIPFEVLQEAAQRLFMKFAALRCYINEREDGYWVLPHDEFSRVEVRCRDLGGGDAWKAELEADANDVLDATKALWRLTLLRGPTADRCSILLTVHHSIVDGSGFFVLLGDLLAGCDATMSGEELAYRAIAIAPALDESLNVSTPSAAVSQLPCPFIPFAQSAPLPCRKTRIATAALTVDATAELERACTGAKRSLNAILASALAIATVRCGCTSGPVAFKTAVSLRDRVRNEDGEHPLGCYITVADTPLDVATTSADMSVEAVAQKYASGLLSFMLKFASRRQAVPLEAIRSRARAILANPYFDHGIGLTTAGVVNVPTRYRHFVVDDWQTINNRVGGNIAFVLHTVQFAGCLKYGLVYAEPLVSRRTVDLVLEEFNRIVREFSERHAGTSERWSSLSQEQMQ